MNVAVAMDARVQVRAGKVADEASADPRKAKHPANRDASDNQRIDGLKPQKNAEEG